MRNADKPISPCLMQRVGDDSYRAHKQGDPIQHTTSCEGLTKREYFAIQILSSYMGSEYYGASPDDRVSDAVRLADALLAELVKQQP